MDVFVARQPIFDRQRQLYAYELLFRSGAHSSAFDGADGAIATTRLLANTLLAIGLENLLCGKKAFINFDRSFLLGGLHSVLPPEILVIEVLESAEPDAEVLAACRRLCEQGYAFALDDFVPDPRREPLARLAKFIKVDLLATSRPDQERLLRIYQPLGIAMLAEKVETQEEFEWALGAGYDYFQGYFFARPATVRAQKIPAAKFACLRLLAEVQRIEPDFGQLEKFICSDVSLSYSLLLYVNSALFWRAAEICSINHALVALGEEGIQHWAALAALLLMAKDKPSELVTLSLVRALLRTHCRPRANRPTQSRFSDGSVFTARRAHRPPHRGSPRQSPRCSRYHGRPDWNRAARRSLPGRLSDGVLLRGGRLGLGDGTGREVGHQNLPGGRNLRRIYPVGPTCAAFTAARTPVHNWRAAPPVERACRP
jgi:EAL and modified HD-GYP domain-containing signal transduction protein